MATFNVTVIGHSDGLYSERIFGSFEVNVEPDQVKGVANLQDAVERILTWAIGNDMEYFGIQVHGQRLPPSA